MQPLMAHLDVNGAFGRHGEVEGIECSVKNAFLNRTRGSSGALLHAKCARTRSDASSGQNQTWNGAESSSKELNHTTLTKAIMSIEVTHNVVR